MACKAFDDIKSIRTISDLIASESKYGRSIKDYCFDEAWFATEFATEFPKEYAALSKERAKQKDLDSYLDSSSIQIACKAIENGADYGTAEGPLQREMYDMLLASGGLTTEERDLMNSEDRMTNFYYVLKILLAILNPDLFAKGVKPSMNFAKSGPQEYCKTCCMHLCQAIINNDIYLKWNTSNLINAAKTNAMLSSTLGNYCCIPRRMKKWDGSLNVGKGINLSLDEYWINDQFALFAEWVDENATSEEQDMIDSWKNAMLLDGKVWKLYRDASEKYKSIWTQAPKNSEEIQGHRLAAFANYLKLVNEAIELRSKRIVDVLQPRFSSK